MNGDLVHLVALAAHGNVFLAREGATPPELEGNNQAFHFTRVKFVRDPEPFEDGFRGTLVAEGTAAWYAHLRELGARNIWLVLRGDPAPEDIPRRMLVAFAGGGDWHLQVDYNDKSEAWHAAWQFVKHPERYEDSYWNVTYAGVILENVPQVEKHDLNVVGVRLRQALVDIEQFARENGEANWAQIFKAAQSELDTGETPRIGDMLPEDGGYSDEARRLLAASSGAWVFGGMGSWNDIVFSGEAGADYDRLSAQLYDAVVAAVVAATNSFERPLWS